MTKETIKQIENDYWNEKADPIDMTEVFDLAIQALEQTELTPSYNSVNTELKPCDDCISRQRVLNDLENVIKGSEHPRQVFVFVDECVDYITSVPSVTPQRKRGKWIKIGKDSRGYTDTFECSECGELIRFMFYMDDCEYDYCPYCLADMRGDTDDNMDASNNG